LVGLLAMVGVCFGGMEAVWVRGSPAGRDVGGAGSGWGAQVAISQQKPVSSRAIATATIPFGLRRASLSWRQRALSRRSEGSARRHRRGRAGTGVGREQDALRADYLDRPPQVALAIDAARGDVAGTSSVMAADGVRRHSRLRSSSATSAARLKCLVG
jgi:hypothetical protein